MNGMYGQQQPPQQSGGNEAQDSSTDAQQSKTLWIGDVEPWMNEQHIAAQFNQIATVTNVKLIRDKARTPVGYGFVEFPDWQTARDVFLSLNGKKIPASNKYFKLNWASHGGGVARAATTAQSQPMHGGQPNMYQNQSQQGSNPGPTEGHQIYVGDLEPSVNNILLMQTFKQVFPSVYEAKIICDPITRVSKGYGFIKFSDKGESERALQEMQGKTILGRAIKMNYASQRNKNQQESLTNQRYGNQNNQMGGGMNQGPPQQHQRFNTIPQYGAPPPMMGGGPGPPGGYGGYQGQPPPYGQQMHQPPPMHHQPQPGYGATAGGYGAPQSHGLPNMRMNQHSPQVPPPQQTMIPPYGMPSASIPGLGGHGAQYPSAGAPSSIGQYQPPVAHYQQPMGLPDLSTLNQNPSAPYAPVAPTDPYTNLGYGQQTNGNPMSHQAPVQASPEGKNNSYDPLDVQDSMPIQPIKIKLPIEPLSDKEIQRLNQEFLQPWIENSEELFMI